MKKFLTLFLLIPFLIQAQQDAKYTKVFPENELGLRKVQLNRLFGYIDDKNKEVVPVAYSYISDFKNGVIYALSSDGKYYLLDSKNKKLIAEELTYVSPDYEQKDILTVANKGLYGKYDTQKRAIIMPLVYQNIQNIKDTKGNSYILASKNQLYGIYNQEGKEVIPSKFTLIKASYNSDYLIVKQLDKMGVIDFSMKIIIPITYQNLEQAFSEDPKNQRYTAQKDNKYGLINQKNEVLVPFKYENIQIVNLGYLVTLNGKKGLINASQEWLIDPVYNDLSVNYSTTDEFSAKKATGWGWTNYDKKEIVPFVYDSPLESFQNGFAKVQKNRKYGLVDRDGKEVIKPQYDYIESFQKDGLTRVSINNKYGLINKSNTVICPFKYSNIGGLDEKIGLRRVTVSNGVDYRNRREGFIDSKGKEIIKPIYINVGYFDYKEKIKVTTEEGKILTLNSLGELQTEIGYEEVQSLYKLKIVTSNSKYGLINENGKFLIPIEYESLNPVGYDEKSNILSFKKNDKWGLIDFSGKVVVEPVYDSHFSKIGKSGLSVKKGELFGILDLNFKEKTPFEYAYLESFSYDLLKAQKNQKFGLIDENGKEVLPIIFDEISYFESNLFLLKKDKLQGLYFFPNKNVSLIEYSKISNFIQNRFIAQIGDKYGVISNEFKTIIPFEYENLESLSTNGLLAFQKNNKKGILNLDNKVLLDASFDEIKYLSNNFMIVGNNEKYGLLNLISLKTGPLEFEKIESLYYLQDKMFLVRKNQKSGIIDTDSKVVVPMIYDEINKDYSEYFMVRNTSKWGLLDLAGKEILKTKYSQITGIKNNKCVIKENSKFGVVDFLDKVIMQPVYDNVDLNSQFNISYQKGSKWGLCDQNGKILTDPKYDEIGQFSGNNRAKVMFEGKYGLIDFTGMELISPIYEDLQEDNYANITKVKSNGKWGIIDNACRQPFPPDFEEITDFQNGIAKYKKGGQFGLVNKYGQILTEKMYHKINFEESYYDSEGFIIVTLNDKMGYIDLQGKERISPVYDKVMKFENGFAFVVLNNKFGLINKQGQLVVPTKYEQFDNFSEGYFSFSQNNKWGVLDTRGNEIVKPKYDNISKFYNGTSIVKEGQFYGIIYASGKELRAPKFKEINTVAYGLFVAKIDSTYGLLNAKGDIILDFEYDLINASLDNVGNLAVKKYGKWSVYNPFMGKVLFDFKFEEQLYFIQGLTKFKIKNLWGVMDINGNEILPAKYNSIEDIYGVSIKANDNGMWVLFDKLGNKIN